MPFGPGSVARARSTSRLHCRSSAGPSVAGVASVAGAGPSTIDAVSQEPPASTVSSSSGSTSDAAPNGRPGVFGVRRPPAEPEAAQQHRARVTAIAVGLEPGGREQLAPRRLRRREPVRPVRLDGPRPADPDERRPLRRPQPERTLEARLDGRGEQGHGVDGGDWRPSPRRVAGIVRAIACRERRQPGSDPGAVRRRSRRPGPHRRHGAFSGKSRSAVAGTGTSAIRASSHADRPQQDRAERRIRVLEPARMVGEQPPGDDLVEGAEPGDARDPRVDRRDRPGGDGVVEVALDQPREPLVEGVRLRLEHAPGAHRVEEQQPGHRPVPGERRQDRVQRRLGAGDRLRLERDRPLHPPDELVGGRLHQLAEDRLLVREVEVDPALRGLGGARDVVDGGVAIAARRERVERRVEDPLAAAATLFGRVGARHRWLRSLVRRGASRASPLPTDWSVGRHPHPSAGNLLRSRRMFPHADVAMTDRLVAGVMFVSNVIHAGPRHRVARRGTRAALGPA